MVQADQETMMRTCTDPDLRAQVFAELAALARDG
jgi:hypothetical protein